MAIKFYIDEQGNYLGGFDGAEPSTGSIEIQSPPAHGLDKWINGAWVLSTAPATAQAQRTIEAICHDCIPAMLSWIASQPNAPAELKTAEAKAVIERAKITKG